MNKETPHTKLGPILKRAFPGKIKSFYTQPSYDEYNLTIDKSVKQKDIDKILYPHGWFVSICNIFSKQATTKSCMLEKVYGRKVWPIPRYLYHTTANKNVESILLNGFVPSTSSTGEWGYPPRVYFGANIRQLKGYTEYIYESNKGNVRILVIDTNLLPSTIKFYHDVQFPIPGSGANAVFTDSLVSSNAIIDILQWSDYYANIERNID